jgi:hypothetical protein
MKECTVKRNGEIIKERGNKKKEKRKRNGFLMHEVS